MTRGLEEQGGSFVLLTLVAVNSVVEPLIFLLFVVEKLVLLVFVIEGVSSV